MKINKWGYEIKFIREYDNGHYDEVEHTVDKRDFEEAIVDCIYDEYFSKLEASDLVPEKSKDDVKKALLKFITDADKWDELYEWYEERIKEIFEEEAWGYLK